MVFQILNLGCPMAELDTHSQEPPLSGQDRSPAGSTQDIPARLYPMLPNLKITYLDAAIRHDFGRDPKDGARTYFTEDHLPMELNTVSKLHFRIAKDPNDNLWYIDDHSSNGTFLNGRKMATGYREVLEDGMKIAICRRDLECYCFVNRDI